MYSAESVPCIGIKQKGIGSKRTRSKGLPRRGQQAVWEREEGRMWDSEMLHNLIADKTPVFPNVCVFTKTEKGRRRRREEERREESRFERRRRKRRRRRRRRKGRDNG